MISRKWISLCTRAQTLQNCFSSMKGSKMIEKNVRTRNFFDFDPMFPDKRDDETKLYRDFERIKKSTNWTHDKVIFERQTNHMVRRIHQSLEREEKIKKLKGIKAKKLSQYVETICENIFLDEETKLPFGIGLDDYIELIKEESITTRTGQFYNTLELICRQVGTFDDIEMIKLYQFMLSSQAADQFKNQARQFLLTRILQEVKKTGGWDNQNSKEVLQTYLNKTPASSEFLQSTITEQNAEQSILPLINEDLVDDQAKNLAHDNLIGKIRFNTNLKKVKLPPRRIDQDDPFFSEESDQESHFAEPLFNYNYLKPQVSDFVNEYKSIGRKVMEDKQIWSKVKQNYFDNKRKYYKEKMYTEEDRSKEKVTKDETLNLIDFLYNTKDEQEIKNLLNKYDLVDDAIPQPNFKNILNNIDYLVDKASTSIKVQIAKKNNLGKDLYFRGQQMIQFEWFLNNLLFFACAKLLERKSQT